MITTTMTGIAMGTENGNACRKDTLLHESRSWLIAVTDNIVTEDKYKILYDSMRKTANEIAEVLGVPSVHSVNEPETL